MPYNDLGDSQLPIDDRVAATIDRQLASASIVGQARAVPVMQRTTPEQELDQFPMSGTARRVVSPRHHERVVTVSRSDDSRIVTIAYKSMTSGIAGNRLVMLHPMGSKWAVLEELDTYHSVRSDSGQVAVRGEKVHLVNGTGPVPEWVDADRLASS